MPPPPSLQLHARPAAPLHRLGSPEERPSHHHLHRQAAVAGAAGERAGSGLLSVPRQLLDQFGGAGREAVAARRCRRQLCSASGHVPSDPLLAARLPAVPRAGHAARLPGAASRAVVRRRCAGAAAALGTPGRAGTRIRLDQPGQLPSTATICSPPRADSESCTWVGRQSGRRLQTGVGKSEGLVTKYSVGVNVPSTHSMKLGAPTSRAHLRMLMQRRPCCCSVRAHAAPLAACSRPAAHACSAVAAPCLFRSRRHVQRGCRVGGAGGGARLLCCLF